MGDEQLWMYRSIEVGAYDFAGTVQVPQEMDDTIAVLTAVVEHGGAIGAEELGVHLLGEGRTGIALQLLRGAAGLGLVQPIDREQWTLTAAGVAALERCDVLVPRRGVLRLRFVDDPFLGDVPLSLDLLRTPGLYESVRSGQDGADPVPASERLRSLLGRTVEGAFVTSTPPVLVEVARDEMAPVSAVAPLDLWWLPTDGIVVLAMEARETSLAAPILEDGVLQQAIASCRPGLDWDAATASFRIRSEDLADVEVRRGELDLDGVAIALDPYGTFVLAEHSLPVSPWDSADAQRWAGRKVVLEVDRYLSEEAFDALVEHVGLEPGPSVPDRAQVAAQLSGLDGDGPVDPRFWWLQAPVDWRW